MASLIRLFHRYEQHFIAAVILIVYGSLSAVLVLSVRDHQQYPSKSVCRDEFGHRSLCDD